MFAFVNYKNHRSARVTKEELADWYTTNFAISAEEAMLVINENWQAWDVPKRRGILHLGFLRSFDLGDLDQEEFKKVQQFMKSAYRSVTSGTMPEEVVDSTGEAPSNVDSQKRKHDDYFERVQRDVRQRKISSSQELQQMLRDTSTRGRGWFEQFDIDKSGRLEKNELVNSLLQTFLGSHHVTRDAITSIVDGIWDAIDVDGSSCVSFDEFQMLREALVAQMNQERLKKAVATITQDTKV
jgi:Ca2+-binding EF-hand superfamily protein